MPATQPAFSLVPAAAQRSVAPLRRWAAAARGPVDASPEGGCRSPVGAPGSPLRRRLLRCRHAYPIDATETALKVVRDADADCVVSSAAAPPRGSARRLPTAPICHRSSSPRPMPAPKSPDPRPDRRRSKDHGPKREHPAGSRHLRSGPYPRPARRHERHEWPQRHGPCVEGLYAQDRNPVSTLMALDGLRAFRTASRFW